MNRRTFLATLAAIPSVGCVATQTPDETTDEQGGGAPTVRSTTTTATDADTLGFGEWHESEYWALTTDDVALTTGFHHADRRSPDAVEMPADEQLVYVALRLKNITPERRRALGFGFLGVRAGNIYDAVRDHGHPDFEQAVGVDDHESVPVDGSRLKSMNREKVSSGTVVRRWFVAVVPRDLALEDVTVAFDDPYLNGEYPVEWRE